MSLENTMLNERSQTQRVANYMNPFYEISTIGTFSETKSLVVARGWGVREKGVPA